MRRELPLRVEAGRQRNGTPTYDSQPGDRFGAFFLHGPCGEALLVIAGDGSAVDAEGWEHVSVSTKRRIPNWIEMSWVKDLFFDEEECVVQYHPRKSQYVNCHPYVLHMWRRVEGFPEPPKRFV